MVHSYLENPKRELQFASSKRPRSTEHARWEHIGEHGFTIGCIIQNNHFRRLYKITDIRDDGKVKIRLCDSSGNYTSNFSVVGNPIDFTLYSAA